MSIHGILQDQLSAIPGQLWFQDSRWGSVAGRQVLLGPLSLVFLYLYAALLFEQTWPVVVACAVLILGRPLFISFPGVPDSMNLLAPVADARFLFWPPLLLLLWAALRTQRWWVSGNRKGTGRTRCGAITPSSSERSASASLTRPKLSCSR